MDKELNIEPFDPEKHEPIDTVGGMKATEYLASEPSPEGSAWNIPTIWYDKETKEPVFLGGKDNSDRAWNAAYRYEKETGIKFPRYKDIPSAVDAAINRSKAGGATKEKLGMAKGGSTMNRQMSMFEEGGIADDGMNRDPVSGNEIPSGSLASEVRDDIPAQLSEGEYVVPADVVRYFGVRIFEEMRNEAKMGLQQMEQDGRIGGEPVEPFQGMAEDDLEEMMEADEPVETSEGMTEDDLDGLEEMMRTGVADGGLMDKIAYTAMNDPLVNQKLNQGGMVVSFASGGMVQSPYNDPTQIDQIIGQFMKMTKSNPGIMNELATRGITTNRTPATDKPSQLQAENAPTETTNPIINEVPIKAAEGTYLDPLSMSGLGQSTIFDREAYLSTPTSISSMYNVPGDSYTYQGPGVSPLVEEAKEEEEEILPVCAEGTIYDPETKTCVPLQVPKERDDSQPGEPYDITKEFRYKAGQVDWSNPDKFQAYMDELSKPQEKTPGIIKFIPGAKMAIGAAQMLERKTTVMKIKGIESLALLTGNAEAAKLAGNASKSYIERLTESQQEYANKQTGDSNMVNIINTIMPKGFLDDVQSSGMQPTLQELQNQLNAEQIAAIDKVLRKGNIAAKVVEEKKKAVKNRASTAAIVAEQKRDRDRNKITAAQSAAATKGVTITGRKDSSGKTQKDAGYKSALKQRQEAKQKVSASLKNRASGGSGGFAKGGLMKKPNKK
jgi:hypothetical protein